MEENKIYNKLKTYLHIRQKDVREFIINRTGDKIVIILSPVSEEFVIDDNGLPIYDHDAEI